MKIYVSVRGRDIDQQHVELLVVEKSVWKLELTLVDCEGCSESHYIYIQVDEEFIGEAID